jgi:hypothetical protein
MRSPSNRHAVRFATAPASNLRNLSSFKHEFARRILAAGRHRKLHVIDPRPVFMDRAGSAHRVAVRRFLLGQRFEERDEIGDLPVSLWVEDGSPSACSRSRFRLSEAHDLVSARDGRYACTSGLRDVAQSGNPNPP